MNMDSTVRGREGPTACPSRAWSETGSLVSAAAALALWRTFWGGPEDK